MADGELALLMKWSGRPAGSLVTFDVRDGRLWVRVDVDDDFYSGELALSVDQTDALSALIAQTPTAL